ncbi:MAG TPA: hypothetical protein VG944_00730 [Fimbriimonas sp.]|nr:hypothetical protein [Fimbriimonas sp.]
MDITRNGSRPSAKGPDCSLDRFESTNYPTHPSQQGSSRGGYVRTRRPNRLAHTSTRLNISGVGWAQREGDSKEEIRPGDVVWFEPGQKQWHGATSTNAMSHIAIQEALNSKVGEWLEHLTDEQYAGS